MKLREKGVRLQQALTLLQFGRQCDEVPSSPPAIEPDERVWWDCR